MITAILNSYKRPHTLKEQYEAIMSQTVGDPRVMLWSNSPDDYLDKFPEDVVKSCTSAFCNENLGVWARFAFALNAETKDICVLDDERLPGTKWFENCLETINNSAGLLGCRGVKITGDDYRNYPGCQYVSYGASNPSYDIEQVDIMGHCWFFEREWLRAYWAELPPVRLISGGEDMHFSYALQKHFGLNTYVPPHPVEDKEMWGSLKSSEYGEDMAATSRTIDGHKQANWYWNFILDNGYKLTKDM